MTMKHSQTCLSPEMLARMSRDDLSPAALQEIEEHVSKCDACRDLLEEPQSDSRQIEIVSILQSPSASHPTAGQHDDSEEESLQSVLQLLGPTDDPHMLGRIHSYEVVGVIGRGGMGVVFKAFDSALDRFVAIKMLAPHLATSGAARKRFARESQAAAAVIDDHVMPIYSVAEWQEIPYLVTQLSRGASLQQRLRDEGPLELKEILRIGMQTARGLAAAHAQGLVHRDVKPSNILLDGDVERALLTDFGLARAVDDASVTRTGVIVGTPQYMSPEQARGGSVDARSDLFSLGSVLYAMCTGRPPFRADSSHAILRLITDEEPRSIREINPDIPQWLSVLISRLMAKSPDSRFDRASEVADVLEHCLAHVQQPESVMLPPSLAPSQSVTASRRQKTFFTGAIVMTSSLVLGLVALIAWPDRPFPDIPGQSLGAAKAAIAAQRKPEEPRSKIKPKSAGTLQGTWAFVRIQSGRPRAKVADVKYQGGKVRNVIGEKTLIQQTLDDGGKITKTSTFDIKVNTEVTPHRLTLKTTKDRLSIRYIYEIKGDTLRMCFFGLGEVDGEEIIAWPSEFSVTKDVSKFPTILTLKRLDSKKLSKPLPGLNKKQAGAVWGQPIEGLQLGVSGIKQGQRFESGNTVRFGLVVRNVSNEVIHLKYNHPKTCRWVAPRIDTADGRRVKFPVTRFRGGHKIYTETLKPDETVALHVSGVLVLGAPDNVPKLWPRIAKPESGEYRLQSGYLIQRLDANGKDIILPTRRPKYSVLSTGAVKFHID